MSASASKKKRKELEEQGLSPKAVAAQEAKEKKQKVLRNALIVVLCVAVAAAAVFAVISLVNKPDYDTKAAVATVGDEKITVPVYNIFYNQSASNLYNYGYSYFIQAGTPLSQQNNVFGGEGTMEDFFKENAANALQTTYNYYIKAKEDGYKLTDEQKDAVKKELDAVKSAAKTYGFTNVNKFLSAYYGKGCTLADYETYLNVNAMYNGYFTKLQEAFAPSAEEIQAKYDEDHGAFDLVNFSYKTVTAESTSVPAEGGEQSEKGENTDPTGDTETPTTTVYSDEAKAEAKETADAYAEEMPEDADTSTNNKSAVTANFNEEIANWLFDAERKEGDVKVFAKDEEGISYYTVRFNSLDTNDYCRVKANIISITKDKEDAEPKEGEQTAKEKYEALIKAVEDGMSDEAFSEAASALGYTVTVSPVNHTYANEEIRSWLFDESRKAGDLKTDIENDTTYYVVRYVGTEEDSYRDTLVKDTLWNEFTESIATAKEITVNEDLLKFANTDLTFQSNNSSES